MHFSELSDFQRRTLVDARQAYQAWSAAEGEMRHHYAGSMRWRTKGGTDYLFRKIGPAEKSLGPRSAETERTHQQFTTGRDAAKLRLTGLVAALDMQAAVARAAGIGRVPQLVARLLRALAETRLLGQVRIVGTNALFAYEALAGVAFSGESLATADIDLLLDARRRLRILTPDPASRSVLGLLRRLDKSFALVSGHPYRAANKDGFMVDLIRPQPNPPRKDEPGCATTTEEDMAPSPIEGLQWLVQCPAIEALVMDVRGYPAPMIVPDPRLWMLHKLWISGRPLRDPVKKRRDAGQALMLHGLIGSHLPQFALDESAVACLPRPLREQLKKLPGKSKEPDGDGLPRPNW